MDFSGAIDELRSFAQAFMVEDTDIIRDVETEVEAGYPRLTPTVVENTRSFGESIGAREEIVLNQAGYEADAARYLPFGTEIYVSDRLSVGDATYEITAIDTKETTAAFTPYVRVFVKRFD